jgi:hypothetical protein
MAALYYPAAMRQSVLPDSARWICLRVFHMLDWLLQWLFRYAPDLVHTRTSILAVSIDYQQIDPRRRSESDTRYSGHDRSQAVSKAHARSGLVGMVKNLRLELGLWRLSNPTNNLAPSFLDNTRVGQLAPRKHPPGLDRLSPRIGYGSVVHQHILI